MDQETSATRLAPRIEERLDSVIKREDGCQFLIPNISLRARPSGARPT